MGWARVSREELERGGGQLRGMVRRQNLLDFLIHHMWVCQEREESKEFLGLEFGLLG